LVTLEATRQGVDDMPSGRAHLIAGAITTTALTCALKLPAELICIGTVAGLLPDVDTKKSILGRWVPLWLFFKHRGFTHSLMALGIASFGCYLLTNSFAITLSFAAGYFSHLVLDWTTPMGIPWRWPKKKLYRLRR
jgi:inner membrane protein